MTQTDIRQSDSLLALACGDSYGSYFEKEGLIGNRFDINLLPDIPVTAKTTDDTKMATILFKHYQKYKELIPNELLKDYQEWAKKDGYKDGIGIHTRKVLLDNYMNKDSQGNGALMRVIPFGLCLINDGYSFEEAVSLMNRESSLTHKNKVVFMANRLSLDIAINGVGVINERKYKDFISMTHMGNTAWIMHSLYIVIAALKNNYNFLDGFKYIVSNGGDTDTNCAIYGAIKGYRNKIKNELNISDFLPS